VTRRHVVEDSVEQDVQAARAALGHEMVEIVRVAQAGIDGEVIERVVPVGDGVEDRAE
jgi:hypothetical protein